MAKTKLKIKELRDFLETLNEEKLTEEIVKLTKTFSEVREYYLVKVKPEYEEEIKEKYKKIIEKEFFPSRGHGALRYSVMRQALVDFKKVSDNKEAIIDLMLTYVENGVEFTLTYGDINENFYEKVEKMYEKALKEIVENKLQSEFSNRCEAIRNGTDGIGWGFGPNMNYFYNEYLNK
jgi:hypothetical protein